MKNICIVVKKWVTAESGDETAVLNMFALYGYSFDEIRILSQSEDKRLRTTLVVAKEEFENILLLCDKSAMPIIKDHLVGTFEEGNKVGGFGNAAIYQEKSRSLFFLSADATETGAEFVKNACIPHLAAKYGVRYEGLSIRAIGASEARVQSLLAQAEQLSEGKIRLNHIRKYDEDVIMLVYDSNSPKMIVDEALRLLMDGLEDTVYALNDVSLEEQLVTLLKLRGKKLSVAESFTGGGIARRLTSVSGASEVYFEGLNTYNEQAKIHRLGVSEYGLRTAGAVSDQTAYEMALGLLNGGNCDFAIATTGLAGPKSDRSMLPVGLSFIAVGTKEKIFVYRYKFDGNRKEITEKAINYALFLAYKQLKNL